MAVQFINNSYQVKAKLTQAALQALNEAGFEVAAHANRHVQLDGDAGQVLRGSYRHVVDEGAGEVQIGTDREEGYWEEFGTGSHADTSKNGGKQGRKDWWVYNEGEPYDGPESTHYPNQAAAQSAATYIRARYGSNAIASNGRDPSYTLENAFTQTKPTVIAEFERLVREGLA
jgi:hypothetical protein